MISRLQSYMMQRLIKRGFNSGEEAQLYLMSVVGNIFAFLVHVYLFIVYMAAGVAVFKWINLFSVIFYILAAVMLKRKKYVAVGLMITVEVLAYSTVFGFLAGADTYSVGLHILIIGLQILFPYGSARLRMIMVVVIVACASAVLAVSLNMAPIVVLSGAVRGLVTFSHMYIMVFGFIIEIGISRLVRQLTLEVEDAKMSELSYQAHTDPLTGLYNRRYAQLFFKGLPHGGGNRCVAILDIDDFKRVNDSLGHDVGDEVLKFLSVFLTGSLRKTDVAFRWGGEEFLVVLDNVVLEDACRALDNLRKKLSESDIHTSRGVLNITISIGVAQINYDDIEGSIRISDDNLYIGKRSGKNIVVG